MSMRIAFILIALGAVLVESTYSMSNDRRLSRRRDTALATDMLGVWNTKSVEDVSFGGDMGPDMVSNQGGKFGLSADQTIKHTDFQKDAQDDQSSHDVTNTAPVEAVDCAIKKSELMKFIGDLKPAIKNVLKVLEKEFKKEKEPGNINTANIQTKEDLAFAPLGA